MSSKYLQRVSHAYVYLSQGGCGEDSGSPVVQRRRYDFNCDLIIYHNLKQKIATINSLCFCNTTFIYFLPVVLQEKTFILSNNSLLLEV